MERIWSLLMLHILSVCAPAVTVAMGLTVPSDDDAGSAVIRRCGGTSGGAIGAALRFERRVTVLSTEPQVRCDRTLTPGSSTWLRPSVGPAHAIDHRDEPIEGGARGRARPDDPRRPRAGPRRRVRRDQPRAVVGRRRASLRTAREPLLEGAPRFGVHRPAPVPARGRVAARSEPRPDEPRRPDHRGRRRAERRRDPRRSSRARGAARAAASAVRRRARDRRVPDGVRQTTTRPSGHRTKISAARGSGSCRTPAA